MSLGARCCPKPPPCCLRAPSRGYVQCRGGWAGGGSRVFAYILGRAQRVPAGADSSALAEPRCGPEQWARGVRPALRPGGRWEVLSGARRSALPVGRRLRRRRTAAAALRWGGLRGALRTKQRAPVHSRSGPGAPPPHAAPRPALTWGRRVGAVLGRGEPQLGAVGQEGAAGALAPVAGARPAQHGLRAERAGSAAGRARGPSDARGPGGSGPAPGQLPCGRGGCWARRRCCRG